MPKGSRLLKPVILVVHGAEIFDTGEVAWLMEILRPARTVVAGVMARTAAEESGLYVEFDGRPPSRIIRSLAGPVALADHAKTPESGRIFGSVIASRLTGRGLVQIECAKRTVIVWDTGDRGLGKALAEMTGYSLETLPGIPDPAGGDRMIRGCLPGESVYVNGIIVGTATEDTVILRRTGSGIFSVNGLIPKEQGFKKLETMCPDLATAWCKSGPIRRCPPGCGTGKAGPSGRIVVIDHCGFNLYEKLSEDCCGVLAIGDDTTAVCGHICSHRGIPVLGIVDGDKDTLLQTAFPRGSVVLESLRERDDDIGREVAGLAEDRPVLWDEWVVRIVDRLRSRVRIAIDNRDPP